MGADRTDRTDVPGRDAPRTPTWRRRGARERADPRTIPTRAPPFIPPRRL